MSNTFAIYNHHHSYNHITKLTLDKRQVVASSTCGQESNNVTICNPTTNIIWYNNTDQEITWKYNNPKLLDYSQVDLYLLYQPSDGTYEVQKNWTSLERSTGVLVQHIDDSWYPSPIQDNSANVSWNMYFYICGAGYDYQSDFALISTAHNFFPAPQIFTLIQSSRNTTTQSTTSTTTTPSATATESAIVSPVSSSSKKLAGWAIAVICIASVLFVAALIFLIWAVRKYNNKKSNRTSMMLAPNNTPSRSNMNDEKIPVFIPSKSDLNVAGSTTAIPLVGAAASAGVSSQKSPTMKQGDNSSIHSSQQVWSPRSMSPRQDDMSFLTTSEKPLMETDLHHPQNASSSILSSTDALMIADTFRQFMRKPEWNEELETERTQERKKLGDELLERQLKKEGTQVQSIQKFN